MGMKWERYGNVFLSKKLYFMGMKWDSFGNEMGISRAIFF